MGNVLTALAVAFAAFVVWLAVRIVNRRERWAKRTAVGLIVGGPALYVVTFGPACWLAGCGMVPMGIVRPAYSPLILLAGSRAGPSLRWYAQLGSDSSEIIKNLADGPAHAEDVDESLFGATRPNAVPAIRARLDGILLRKVNSVQRTWSLSKLQVQKLELAGGVDINQLLGKIEEHGRDLKAAKQDVNEVYVENSLNRTTSAIRSMLRSGPFGDDSSFHKSLNRILTRQQAAEFEQRALVAAKSPAKISRANAADMLRTARLNMDVYRIVWKRGGTQVGFLQPGKVVEIYSFPEMQLVCTAGNGDNPQSFDLGPIADLVAIGKNSKEAAILNVATGKKTRLATGNSYPVVKFGPKGDILATGGEGKTAQLWSVPAGELIREFAVGDVKGMLTPDFSPDGMLLAVGNLNSTTHVFEVSTGRLLHVLPKTRSRVLHFDPAGETLAVVYVDGSLVLWDASTGQPKHQVVALANELYTVDWSADGRILTTGGRNAPVTLWNAEDLSILNELECPEFVYCVRFSPDGTRLLVAGSPRLRTDENLVEIWAVP
jgi:WD40 repeat protein